MSTPQCPLIRDMSKVFEALERQQNSRTRENGHDRLAAENGASDVAPDDAVEERAGQYELPAVIGAPVGPRSNDGIIFPSLNAAFREGDAAAPAPQARTQTHGRAASTGNQATAYAPATNGLRASTPAESPPRLPGLPNPAAEAKQEQRPPEVIQSVRPVRAPREIPVERMARTQVHPRLILLTEPHAPECEQYRTLRTQLFHAAERKTTQIVVITSALASEGKTSTVLNLALAIAQSKEKRVLVIDGDLRSPNIAAYLGVAPKLGLEEVLEGKREPLDAIVCLDAHELYVLPVRAESEKPTELLSSGRLEMLVREVREYFDFILIDSPPVMPFADARLLANHADAVVLVVRAGLAPYETVEKAVDVLPAQRLLGVVLNGAEHMSGADYYDYPYGYSRRDERRRSVWERIKRRVVGRPG